MRENFSDRLFYGIVIAALTMFALVMIFPLYYIVAVSFSDPTYYIANQGKIIFPVRASLESYKFLFSTDVIKNALVISIFITVTGTILSLITNAGLSYAITRKKLRGRKIIMVGVLITMVFNPGIIPSYLVVQQLKLIDHLWALMLPVLTSGWYVILMRGFFDSLPESMQEAAVIDGCNDISIWFRIILPLSMPSIAAFSLFYAVGYWNTYIAAVLYINKPSLWPLQVIIRNLLDSVNASASADAIGEMRPDMPSDMLKMAAIVIGVTPILMVYPFLQKHFTKGAMLGAIKE